LTEWWYYNGKLTTTTGRKFGYFIAVFHIIPPEKKQPESVLMLQLTDIDNQKVYGTTQLIPEKSAAFSTDVLNIQLGKNFSLRSLGSSYVIYQNISIPNAPKIKLSLVLAPVKAPLLINKYGLLELYDDTNSYYYSQVRMKTTGTMEFGDTINSIESESSLSWMDHQWGDFVLSPKKSRWIWTCAALNNGMDFSAWELIDPASHKVMWKLANVILPDDSRFYTTDIDIQASGRDKRSHYPSRYDVTISPLNLKVTLNSLAPNQNTNGFWEGAHEVAGQYVGDPVTGFSYVENTVELQKHN
jgi:predicted secreted hydrolase